MPSFRYFFVFRPTRCKCVNSVSNSTQGYFPYNIVIMLFCLSGEITAYEIDSVNIVVTKF